MGNVGETLINTQVMKFKIYVSSSCLFEFLGIYLTIPFVLLMLSRLMSAQTYPTKNNLLFLWDGLIIAYMITKMIVVF